MLSSSYLPLLSMVTSVHHKCCFKAMRVNLCNIRKCLGSRFLADTKLTHGKIRRGWVYSSLLKARGIVVGTEEAGKCVCLKMKNPFFYNSKYLPLVESKSMPLLSEMVLLVSKTETLWYHTLILQVCHSAHQRNACHWGSLECWGGGAVTESK